MHFTSVITPYTRLCKLRISLVSALSAVTGYVMAQGEMSGRLVILFFGVLVTACGASALNQYQERKTDARMERTRHRPLPQGRIRPGRALCFSIFLILSGLSVLNASFAAPVMLLGLGAVLWYNGLYTFLKKKSAFAVFPGALIGALPPAMGWAASETGIPVLPVASLCFLFFLWQVPHFWLHMHANSEDYARAGLPTLHHLFSDRQISRITYVWIVAAAVSSLIIPVYADVSAVAAAAIAASACWITIQCMSLLNRPLYAHFFRMVNAYMLLIIVCINAGILFS